MQGPCGLLQWISRSLSDYAKSLGLLLWELPVPVCDYEVEGLHSTEFISFGDDTGGSLIVFNVARIF